MFMFRRIGRLLRGKATPLHIYMACILGAWVGFAPGFTQGPGLLIALFVLLAVLNANLAAAVLTAIPAKLLALLLMPLSFLLGRLLLDGPTQPIFKWMVNAPVLALFGLEYYATTGGLLLGLIFGALVGYGMVRAVMGFRRKLADLEEGSDAYRRYTNTWWSRSMTFVFVGGSHGKLTYRQLLERSRLGNPIRPIGTAFVALVAMLAVVAQMFFSEPIVTWAVQRGLERANGATVEVQSARLDLRAGRFEAQGVAMADPNALHTDLLRVGEVEGDVSAADLLRKRLRMDRVVLIDASSGQERLRPGRRIGPPPSPTPPDEDDWKWGDKTLDEILHEAEVWKQRLAQVREWLERLDRARPDPEERRETLRERLEREIRQKGYRYVAAAHLIDHAPWLTVTQVVALRVEAMQLGGEMIEVRGENLSTQPWLLDDRPRLHVRSESGRFDVELELPALARSAVGENIVRFTYLGLSGDAIGRQLAFADVRPLEGGTIDVTCDGRWSEGLIDFPLRITLHDAKITIPGVGSTDVSQLLLPIAVRGPLDNPRVTLNDEDLADALVAAGKAELAGRVRAEADKAIDEARDRVQDRIGEEAGRLFDRLNPDRRR